MEIQYGKMILYGILHAIIYIAVPLILFEVLEMMGIMSFSQMFKIFVIAFGVIGVVFSMLSHAFPKDTSANRLIAFGATIYSGIFLFYIFGGFTPGVSLGTYSIELPTIQVLLGLQLIAWLFLASMAIRALQYFVEAIELRKKKKYTVRVKKQFKLSRVFKVFGILMSLFILGYFGSLIYSGMNLGLNLQDIHPGDVSYSDEGTPDPSDDILNITITFDLDNQGIYAIYDVYLDVDIYTVNTANPAVLPENTKIGESMSNYFPAFHSFTPYPDQKIVLQIDTAYAYGLNTTDATLKIQISFTTLYANINIYVNLTVLTPWTVSI